MATATARAEPFVNEAPSRGPKIHLDYIDGMRAAAALVVVNHSYAQAWCAFYGQFPPPEFAFLSYSLAVGHLAVSVFIVISGFCLSSQSPGQTES